MADTAPNQFDLKIHGETVEVKPREVQIKKSSNYLMLFYVGSAGQMAFAILVPLLLGIFAGVWLDSKYATKPLWTLLGLAIGIILSVLSLIGMVRDILKKMPPYQK